MLQSKFMIINEIAWKSGNLEAGGLAIANGKNFRQRNYNCYEDVSKWLRMKGEVLEYCWRTGFCGTVQPLS